MVLDTVWLSLMLCSAFVYKQALKWTQGSLALPNGPPESILHICLSFFHLPLLPSWGHPPGTRAESSSGSDTVVPFIVDILFSYFFFYQTGCRVLFVLLYWVKLALCSNMWWIWEKVPWGTGKKVYSLGFDLNGLQVSFRSIWFMVPLNIRIPLFSFVWITCILMRVRYGSHALSLG